MSASRGEWETVRPKESNEPTESKIVIPYKALNTTVLGAPLAPSPLAPTPLAASQPPLPVPPALTKSFAKLFQVSGAVEPLSDAAAAALAERIVREIVQPSGATDFTEILQGTQKIRIANNAAAGIKKARVNSSSLKRTVTLIPLEMKPVGRGSYGTIYKAISPEGEPKVLKEIRIDEGDTHRNQLLRGTMTELLIQHILASDPVYGKYVAKPHTVFMDLSFPIYKIYIYMEQIPQTFKDYMKTGPTVAQLKALFIQIAKILKHFRDTYTFYHCDFHIGNMMMGVANPVIIDFGFSSLTYPGLPRIFGKYLGEEPVNDLLIFVAAFISTYSGQFPAFTSYLRGFLRADNVKNPARGIADAYAVAEEQTPFGDQLFHNFYYFRALGNPVFYSYPRLEYANVIAELGTATLVQASAVAPLVKVTPLAEAVAVPSAEPTSLGLGLMPFLPGYAPGDLVGEERSRRLLSIHGALSIPAAQPSRVGLSPIPEEGSVIGHIYRFPSSKYHSIFAAPLNNRLSGKKRSASLGGTRKHKPKRRVRKTRKRPSRR